MLSVQLQAHLQDTSRAAICNGFQATVGVCEVAKRNEQGIDCPSVCLHLVLLRVAVYPYNSAAVRPMSIRVSGKGGGTRESRSAW